MWPGKSKEETPTLPADPKNQATPPASTPELKYDEIVQKISEGLVPQISAAVEAQVKPLRDRFEAIEQSSRRPKQETPPGDVPRTDFFDDPEKAFAERVSPVLLETYRTRAEMIERETKLEFPEGAEFKEEINKELQGTPIIAKADMLQKGTYEEYVRRVIFMVLGRAATQKGLRFDGKSKSFFLEDAGSSSPEGQDKGKEDLGLSPKQLRAAEKWGIDPKEYAAAQKKLEYVS